MAPIKNNIKQNNEKQHIFLKLAAIYGSGAVSATNYKFAIDHANDKLIIGPLEQKFKDLTFNFSDKNDIGGKLKYINDGETNSDTQGRFRGTIDSQPEVGTIFISTYELYLSAKEMPKLLYKNPTDFGEDWINQKVVQTFNESAVKYSSSNNLQIGLMLDRDCVAVIGPSSKYSSLSIESKKGKNQDITYLMNTKGEGIFDIKINAYKTKPLKVELHFCSNSLPEFKYFNYLKFIAHFRNKK